MKYESTAALSRREFLVSAAALPALMCVTDRPARAAEPGRKAPYLSLEPFLIPGKDEFANEAAAFSQRASLQQAFASRRLPLAATATGAPALASHFRQIAPDLTESVFEHSDRGLQDGWERWIESLGRTERVQFFVLPDNLVRFEVKSSNSGKHTYRTGHWRVVWREGVITEFRPVDEYAASAAEPWFRDVTQHCLGALPAFQEQLRFGVPYWRARLDPATGIDIYGSNGVAVGDIDGDGSDEIYVCQPGGLPNRLFKVSAEGKLTDITAAWGVDILDDTSCALFLDLRNCGRQDLVVLKSTGPVLFLNESGSFRLHEDAFQFANVPRGGFTGMAAADFDRDGKLDLYLCCYVYFQSEAQYTYASPYHDAQNGPPNFLFRNRLHTDGSGNFIDCTSETGMDDNNNRFSFAPAWCDYNGDGWPDLYVANDFGRKNLYLNENGHFRDVAAEAKVEDIGPGMSASWFDYDGDGNPDLYIGNMWTDAGQRITHDARFEPAKTQPEAYRAHTMGNSLYRNRGDGTFENTTAQQGVGFGRWAWAAGGHDLDNDGNPEVFVTCGMLTNSSEEDLNSFFWRQVVARSPAMAAPSAAYENGWNAINQFVREERSWSGHEPNVLHASRGERFFDFSGVSGLDFAQDGRAFAVLDFDGDGRPDVVLKSRLGPQVRVLQNNCGATNGSIAFQLRGTKSNRDAIGARVEVDGRTKWLEAGSGFLSQHSKRLIFGLRQAPMAKSMRVAWPSGEHQEFSNLRAGATYFITEGSQEVRAEPFREHVVLPANPIEGDDTLALHDTWLREPVPLPASHAGPGLFVVKEPSSEFSIFRRYLFDWRTELRLPLAMLLDKSGDVAKVYGAVPSAQRVQADLLQLNSDTKERSLPCKGFYIREPRRDFFKFGVAFLWAGFPDKAMPYLQRVLQQNPENARVLVLVGQIQLESDQVDEAARSFAKAAAADPASLNAFIGLGDIAAKQGRLDEAAVQYGKALALDPQSAEASNALGLTQAKKGNLAEAQQLFQKAIERRRDYGEAINNLAVLYAQQGKVNDAVAAWTYGIKMAPDEDILYLNLGRTYVQMGQKEKARLAMQELLDRKPDNATARRALQDLSGR